MNLTNFVGEIVALSAAVGALVSALLMRRSNCISLTVELPRGTVNLLGELIEAQNKQIDDLDHRIFSLESQVSELCNELDGKRCVEASLRAMREVK